MGQSTDHKPQLEDELDFAKLGRALVQIEHKFAQHEIGKNRSYDLETTILSEGIGCFREVEARGPADELLLEKSRYGYLTD